MRISIELSEIDPSFNSFGWDIVTMYLFDYEASIKLASSKKSSNVIFAGLVEDISYSLLEVIVGNNDKVFLVTDGSGTRSFSALEKIKYICKSYPNHKYCIILKEQLEKRILGGSAVYTIINSANK